MSKRNRIRKQVNHHPSSRILAEKYKCIKNLSTIRYAKIKHTTQIVKSIENPKKLFETINLVMGKNITQSILIQISAKEIVVGKNRYCFSI